MKVTLFAHTEDPEFECFLAAKTCTTTDEDFDNLQYSFEEVKKTLRFCLKSGHESVFEHASFTFRISGISRACTHQLVRHRLASYSQQSQRYVNMTEAEYVIPPSIEAKWPNFYDEIMNSSWAYYNQLVEDGIPEEDARYVLPNACCTSIVVTMNCRELLHFFKLRCCNKAQWEIRGVAKEMQKICKIEAPIIFEKSGPNCISEGKCREVKSCKAKETVKHELMERE